MAPDLLMCAYVALFAIALNISTIAPTLIYQGLLFGVGNRDGQKSEEPAWAERLRRAHRNMLENVLPFGILAFVAHTGGVDPEVTAWGAQLFLIGRIAHAVIYVAGIPWVRTAAFAVSLNGMMTIAWAILAL